jgi:hypothetical protein
MTRLLLLFGVLLLAAVIFVVSKLSRRGGTKDLGWMSEQWLAEHRWSRRH